MIRITPRTARKEHRCTGGSCRGVIRPGELYPEHVASPAHDAISSGRWERLRECRECAHRYGRGLLLAGDAA